jgi:hypothetical protein
MQDVGLAALFIFTATLFILSAIVIVAHFTGFTEFLIGSCV